MRKPIVLVGTLHSNEGDFEKCCASVNGQRDVTVIHRVISGLNEKDAHNALWDEHRKLWPNFDVFVKVDADMVLRSTTTLKEICECLESRQATSLRAPLHDYMTDKLINGMHAYTNKVTFTETTDALYCDRNACMNDSMILVEKDLPSSLRPVGKHCHYATPIQAFRYAYHRSIKNQRDTMQDLIYAWRRHGDRTRGMGVIAVMLAAKLVKLHGSDYNDAAFDASFRDAERRYDEYVQAINENRLDVFD